VLVVVFRVVVFSVEVVLLVVAFDWFRNSVVVFGVKVEFTVAFAAASF
jgi:hypothetical protein